MVNAPGCRRQPRHRAHRDLDGWPRAVATPKAGPCQRPKLAAPDPRVREHPLQKVQSNITLQARRRNLILPPSYFATE